MSADARRPSLWTRLANVDDGSIIRAAFYLMLAGTLAVLYIDYRELMDSSATELNMPSAPILPAFDPNGPAITTSPAITSDPELLRQPLAVSLQGGGVLALTGTIDVGSAERVTAEVAARGEYIKTVALDSPGGSVNDALAIGALIRGKGFATSVADGALCASSCPLIFASGVTREAGLNAAIGVHQIYAMAASGDPPQGARAVGTAMSDAQSTTAIITHHLGDMGVDPALWLNALETPPDRLYYFSRAELERYRLVTKAQSAGP